MGMHSVLAYADSSDPTQTNFILILLSAGGIAGVCVMAGLVILLSRRMGSRYSDHMMTAAFFWGVIAAGSIIYAASAQLSWAHEHMADLQSGYGNPQDAGPSLPWIIWGVLAAVYVGLLAWTMWKKV